VKKTKKKERIRGKKIQEERRRKKMKMKEE
jgi:hypothetical protein